MRNINREKRYCNVTNSRHSSENHSSTCSIVTNVVKCSYLCLSVYPDGRVCISILHAPGDDPMGYESSAERWSPVQSVEKILLSVVSMLAGNRALFFSSFSLSNCYKSRERFRIVCH